MKKFIILALILVCIGAAAYAEDYVLDLQGGIIGHNFNDIPAPLIEYDQWGNITRFTT